MSANYYKHQRWVAAGIFFRQLERGPLPASSLHHSMVELRWPPGDARRMLARSASLKTVFRKIPAATYKHGFTLPELLLAVAIFSFVTLIVGSSFVNAFRINRKANLENQVYEDARFILDRIAKELHEGAIDYEEYYNQRVKQGQWGQNYGAYHSQFFHRGEDKKLGFRCNDHGQIDPTTQLPIDHRNDPDPTQCTPLRKDLDTNTGQNPYRGKGGLPDSANAFCEEGQGDCPATKVVPQDELYLISSDGKTKTILAPEKIGKNAYALSMVKLVGRDLKNDNIMDVFSCSNDFQCGDTITVGTSTLSIPRPRERELRPNPSDLQTVEVFDVSDPDFNKDFIPISPLRSTISSLKFFISPMEDPYKAFAEESLDVQQQPHVTIVLTVSSNPDERGSSEGTFQATLVLTINSGARKAVPSPLTMEE